MLLQREAPWIFYEFIQRRGLELMIVAAVNETDLSGGETVRRVPKRNFRSYKIDKLAEWIADRIVLANTPSLGTSRTQERRSEYNPPMPAHSSMYSKSAEPPQDSGDKSNVEATPWWQKSFGFVTAGILYAVITRGCDQSTAAKRPQQPRAAVVTANYDDLPGVFDDCVRSTVNVRNDGAAGAITVTVMAYEQGREVERQQESKLISAGGTAEYVFSLCKIYSVKNPHEVRYEVAPR